VTKESRSFKLHFDVETNLLAATRTKWESVNRDIYKKLLYLRCSIYDQKPRLLVTYCVQVKKAKITSYILTFERTFLLS